MPLLDYQQAKIEWLGPTALLLLIVFFIMYNKLNFSFLL